MSEVEDFFKHYGVLGMKWGRRRPRCKDGRVIDGPVPVEMKLQPGKRVKTKGGQNRPASQDAKTTAALKQIARKSTTDALSNAQLKALNERISLEVKFAQLAGQPARKSGAQFVMGLLKKESSTQVSRVASAIATKHVNDVLQKKGYMALPKPKDVKDVVDKLTDAAKNEKKKK